MQRDAPPNRATVNHWNTCHRDYGAGLAFFQENSIRIVCSSPPLFAISDVLSIVLGPESAGVERANDFVMDPPLTHSFDSTGTVAVSNATKVEALGRMSRFLAACKEHKYGQYKAAVERFESTHLKEFSDVLENAAKLQGNCKVHIGWLRYPRPRGRNLKGKLWNYFSNKWHAMEPTESELYRFYDLLPDSKLPGAIEVVCEPTAETVKLHEMLTDWDPDVPVAESRQQEQMQAHAFLWEALSKQDGWTTVQDTYAPGVTFYVPQGVTRGVAGTAANVDYFDNLKSVVRHCRQTGWRGWKPPTAPLVRYEAELVDFYTEVNCTTIVDASQDAGRIAQSAATNEQTRRHLRRYIGKYQMGQATVGQRAGVAQCDVSNWLRGLYQGARNEGIGAKFRALLVADNWDFSNDNGEEVIPVIRGKNSDPVSVLSGARGVHGPNLDYMGINSLAGSSTFAPNLTERDQLEAALVANSGELCPVPGCNGNGHRVGGFAKHRSIWGCPMASAKQIQEFGDPRRNDPDFIECSQCIAGSGKPVGHQGQHRRQLRAHEVYLSTGTVSKTASAGYTGPGHIVADGHRVKEIAGIDWTPLQTYFDESMVTHYRDGVRRMEKRIEPLLVEFYNNTKPMPAQIVAWRKLSQGDADALHQLTENNPGKKWNEKEWLKPGNVAKDPPVFENERRRQSQAELEGEEEKDAAQRVKDFEKEAMMQRLFGENSSASRTDIPMVDYFKSPGREPVLVDFYFQVWKDIPREVDIGSRVRMRFPDSGPDWFEGAVTKIFPRRKVVDIKFDDDRVAKDLSYSDPNLQFFQQQAARRLGGTKKKHRRSVVHFQPTNLFQARSEADRTYYKEHYDWCFRTINGRLNATDRFDVEHAQKKQLLRLARRGGCVPMEGYTNYIKGLPVKTNSQVWRENMSEAAGTSVAAVSLNLTILETGLNVAAMNHMMQDFRRRDAGSGFHSVDRRTFGLVRSVLDTVIRAVESENKPAWSPRASQPYAPPRPAVRHTTIEFASLRDGMQVEVMYEDVWHPAVVKEVNEEDVLLYYPKTTEEERLESADVKPGMLRRLLDAAIIKQKDGSSTAELAQQHDPGLAAIKKMKDIAPRDTQDTVEHERMHKVWDALTCVGDGYYRSRSKSFMKLPPRAAVPEYYEQIQRPIHLESIRKKIIQKRYRDFDEFEEDVTVLIENARAFYDRDSMQYKDIEVLQNVFWEAFALIEQDQPYELQETPGVFKRSPMKRKGSAFTLAAVTTDPGERRETRKMPSEVEKIEQVLNEVCDARESGINLSAVFMKLPKTAAETVVKKDSFPTPLMDAPELSAGEVDKLAGKLLKNMVAQGLPTEETLRTWTLESQQAFWAQRRAHWNKMKLRDLQRECRKKDIWPGGDAPYIKDRLLRYDFARSLLLPCETRTEAQEQEELLASQYYDVIEDPIDVETIRQKLTDAKYLTFQEFEKDFNLMVENGQSYNEHSGEQAFPHTENLNETFKAAKRSMDADIKRLDSFNKLADRHNAKLDQATRVAALGPYPDLDKVEFGLTWKEFGAKYAPWFNGPNSREVMKLWKDYRALPGRASDRKGREPPAKKPKIVAPPLKDQLLRVFTVVNSVKDEERLRAAVFLELPEKSEPLEPFPEPLSAPPAGLAAGSVVGEPNANVQPTEYELRTWTKQSQLKFWDQRKAMFNKMKLTELQRACAKRDIYPGGDKALVLDRLLRNDFCKSQLIERETWNEADHAAIETGIGMIYYGIIKKPIDMSMIKQKIESQEYGSMDAMAKDMTLLFDNARKFDGSVNPESEREVSADADALEAAMKQTIKDTLELLKKIERAQKEQEEQEQKAEEEYAKETFKLAAKAAASAPASEKLLETKPSFKEQLMTIFDAVWAAKDSPSHHSHLPRQRCELFKLLPERQEIAPASISDYPDPRPTPGEKLVCGTVNMLVKGMLPTIADKDLPEEEDLRTWTRESQLAFWHQRKKYWNRQKQRDLQKTCRKRFIWPGGESIHLKDRLLMFDFAYQELTDWEARSEEDARLLDDDVSTVYYELVKEPIDLAIIKKKIEENKYTSHAKQPPEAVTIGYNRNGVTKLQKDLKLLFDNSKQFDAAANAKPTSLTKDSDALQKVVDKAVLEIQKNVAKIHSANEKAVKKSNAGGGGGKKRSRSSGGGPPKKLREAPTVSQQLNRVFDAVCSAKDGDRARIDLFLQIPEKSEPLEELPVPLEGPPELATGDVEITKSTLQMTPEEDELRTWTRESQVKFWEERRILYNRLKLSELVRLCRKQDLFPGGDAPYIKDRLLRRNFCPSQLIERETWTEEEGLGADADLGRFYFNIITDPIDITTIRAKLEGEEYDDMEALEADLNKLFTNARALVTKGGADSGLSKDADELSSVMRNTVREMEVLTKSVEKHNEAVIEAAERAANEEPDSDMDEDDYGSEDVIFLMDDAWEAVRNARLESRRLSDTFMSLPSSQEFPTYFEEVSKPMDLTSIRSRIDDQKYRRWEQFEKDMMLIFSNAKSFHGEGSALWEDAHALENVFLAQRTDKGFRKTQGGARKSGAKRQRASRALLVAKKELPTMKNQLVHVLETVCESKDGERLRAQVFLELPQKMEPLEPFPKPLKSPPELASGDKEVTIVSQTQLPEEEELRTWTRDSQLKFWEYRRLLYNRFKLSELCRQCRRRDLYPGGDKPFILDRLMRRDFCPSMLIERERWTEEEHAEEVEDIGRVYYDIISDPIDIAMIRSTIQAGDYEAGGAAGAMAALEADLNKLFANANTFVMKGGGDSALIEDANVLSSVMRNAVKEMEALVKSVEKHNEAIALQSAADSGASPREQGGGDPREHSAAAPISPIGSFSGGGRASGSLGVEWTAEEDAMVVELVREGGAGDWQTKTEKLGTGRSATGLRKRWKKLSDSVDFIPRAVVAAPASSPSAVPAPARTEGPTRNDLMRNALAAVRAKKDRGGRVLSELFEELPSADDYPDYFELIETPIDLETIEGNIAKKYKSRWESFDRDMSLMFENAKTYNAEGSDVYEDAVVLEKLFRAHNFRAQPTPAEGEASPRTAPEKSKLASGASPRTAPEKSKLASGGDKMKAQPGSQQMMRNSLAAVRAATAGKSGRVLSELFEELPSEEDLPDYYELIKTPMDLETIGEKIPGYKGRYHIFERDMLLVFENARTYNAEGSDIYEDAKALEKHFRAQPKPGGAKPPSPPAAAAAAVASGGSKRRRSSADGDSSAAAAAKAAKIAASKKPKGVLMREAWAAVREATDPEDDEREMADAFVQLPSADDYPDYFQLIKNPMDLRSVKEKVDEGSYRRWDGFERDMLLIFENAKTYNVEGSDVYEDAVELEKIFRMQPKPAEAGGKNVYDPSEENERPQWDKSSPAESSKRKSGGGSSSGGGKKRRR